jgi:flagellar biosynthesis anti-sigma factor FlgM
MKIQPPNGRPAVGPAQETREANASKSVDGQQRPVGSEERVQVSSLSKLLSSVRAEETTDPAKVERLRESINAGAFVVEHERVAEAMLQEEV